jgi:hypothetical protein
MSEYQDHIRQSLEGQHEDPREDLGMDAMRWTPAPVSDDVTDEGMQSAAETAHALLDRAADAYLSLLTAVLGDGTHHLVASATTPQGDLVEGQQLAVHGDTLMINELEAMRVCAVIAAGMVGCTRGGLVVRTFGPDGSESVRGWVVRSSWLQPLTAHDIQEAYRTDHATGAPLSPEEGVEYREAERVPCPDQVPGREPTGSTAPGDNRPPNRGN